MTTKIIKNGNSTLKSIIDKDNLNWSIITLSDVLNKNKRLEASFFDIESKHIRNVLKSGKYPLIQLYGQKDSLIDESYYPGRFKRVYVNKNNGEDFFLPSQIIDIYPKADKWISKLTKVSIEDLRLKKNTLLLTRSGTIGNITIVTRTLEKKVFSDDVIRVTFKNIEDLGYVYTFLKSEYGNNILKTNSYGSVITHIEPEHLKEMIIPNPPYLLKKKIHDLIMESYSMRDDSNDLVDKATKFLIKELNIPPIEKLENEAFSYSEDILTFSKKLSDLNGRLEASYHTTLTSVIEKYLLKNADLVKLNDNKITDKIILAGIFKRNYVQKGHGYPFIGVKEITQLIPETDKFLSKVIHKNRYEKELKVNENWILVTDRGTIGKVAIVPKHIEGTAVSQNVLKIITNKFPGYVYCFLNSEYGEVLIKRQSYGSVVNMIDNNSLGEVKIPVLRDGNKVNKINELILKANELRYQAYLKENEAIQIMNKDIFGI